MNPYIGKRPINQITPIELLALIRKVEDRGAINVAHRVHCTAHSVWCYAVAIGRADRDITPDIKKALKPHTMKRTVSQKVNGQAHTVPLPRQVVAILRGLHPVTGNGEFVFHQPRKPRNALSEAGITPALHALGYKGIQTWHGFRATGRTIIRQVFKIDPDVIEAQLAHKGQITHGGAYDRATFQDERAVMLQRWADYLDQLRQGGEVIQLKAA